MKKNFSSASAHNLMVGLTRQDRETISCFQIFQLQKYHQTDL